MHLTGTCFSSLFVPGVYFEGPVSPFLSFLLYSIRQHPHSVNSQPSASANRGPSCLTSVFSREPVFPTWYSRIANLANLSCHVSCMTVPEKRVHHGLNPKHDILVLKSLCLSCHVSCMTVPEKRVYGLNPKRDSSLKVSLFVLSCFLHDSTREESIWTES